MSSIEWTDRTWNPVTGCSKISPGCANCYAAGIAKRFWGDRPFTDVQFHPERLEQPTKWRKPQRVFVNSMSDLFHGDVPLVQTLQVWSVMKECPRHTFQILTKRPQRMLDVIRWMSNHYEGDGFSPLSNVHLGVTVENQKAADKRIPLLMQTPAAIRFLSCEPLLEPIDLRLDKYPVDWAIVGGESGPKARPFHLEWAEDIIEQCQVAGVKVFVKQIGSNPRYDSMPYGTTGKGNDPTQWPVSIQVRQLP